MVMRGIRKSLMKIMSEASDGVDMTPRRIYELVSVVFSAPFIALYVVIRVYLSGLIGTSDLVQSIIWLTIIPVLVPVYYSVRLGVEWDYPKREDRLIPFLIINLGYLYLYVLLLLLDCGKPVLFLAASYLINGFAAWAISMKYKISIHMIGISGPATYFLLLGYSPDATALYAIGLLTGYARSRLGRHSLSQLIGGYVQGIILTLIAYMVTYGW
jgi:membrane-associated phospholipid phosphatase